MSTEGDLDVRAQLDHAMNERRKQLRLKWNRVAEIAGMTYGNLHKIRTGQIAVSEDAAYGIEVALRWPHGYVNAILVGEEPPSEADDPKENVRRKLDELRAELRDEYGEEEADRLFGEVYAERGKSTPDGGAGRRDAERERGVG